MTKRDFEFTRRCDDHYVGHRQEGKLEVAFISPVGDSYRDFLKDERCVLDTNSDDGRVLIRLPDDDTLGRELRTYIQTNSYVTTKETGSLPDTTKRILRDRSEDNRARRKRIIAILRGMLDKASYFASGQKLEIERTDPKEALADAMEYLIKNAYPKMGYIDHLHPNPKQEIQSILRANDVDSLGLEASETNPQAVQELRQYVQLSTRESRQIVLHDLIDKKYGERPFGWPGLEVALLVARLAVLKEIDLVVEQAALPLDQAYDYLTSSSKQRKVIVSIVETNALSGSRPRRHNIQYREIRRFS